MRRMPDISWSIVAALLGALSFPMTLSAQQTSDPPAYKPPSRGAPASRVGGGSRGAGDDTPRLAVLAPDHTGLTTKEQPSLYWFVSKPVAAKLEVTVINDQTVKPMLEKSLAAPAHAGIQQLRLADYGVKLEPGIEYRWHVALIVDPSQRSDDVIASGTIQRIVPDAALRARLAGADRSRLPFLYASEGLWYDAIEAVSALIERDPKDRSAQLQRASLLEQVGLDDAARADRQVE